MKKCMIDFDTDKLMLLIRLHHGKIEVPGVAWAGSSSMRERGEERDVFDNS